MSLQNNIVIPYRVDISDYIFHQANGSLRDLFSNVQNTIVPYAQFGLDTNDTVVTKYILPSQPIGHAVFDADVISRFDPQIIGYDCVYHAIFNQLNLTNE